MYIDIYMSHGVRWWYTCETCINAAVMNILVIYVYIYMIYTLRQWCICETRSVTVNALRMKMSCHTCECVMSCVWVRHVTHVTDESCDTMDAPCHTYEEVMPCIWMDHVTHDGNDSRDVCECVMSCAYVRCVTRRNTSRYTYEWVISCV